MCVFLDRPSSGSKTVENASNAAVELWLSALSPGWQLFRVLAALQSQSSGIERPLIIFFAMSRGHMRPLLYMYKQQWRGFYSCIYTVRVLYVIHARSVF